MALPTDSDLPVVLHNPSCSKSRALCSALDKRGVAYATRLYLQDPLDEAELVALLVRLDGEPATLVRKTEREFKNADFPDDPDAESVARTLAARPRLMERPVLIVGRQARIGRPKEAALELLPSDSQTVA